MFEHNVRQNMQAQMNDVTLANEGLLRNATKPRQMLISGLRSGPESRRVKKTPLQNALIYQSDERHVNISFFAI